MRRKHILHHEVPNIKGNMCIGKYFGDNISDSTAVVRDHHGWALHSCCVVARSQPDQYFLDLLKAPRLAELLKVYHELVWL